MKLKIKNPLDPVINFVDDKLKKFDPIWMAENGVGGQRTRYYDQTGIAKYREWRGVKDTMTAYVCWLKNLGMMGLMMVKAPTNFLKAFWEYRWMGSYLATFAFLDRLFEGYRGYELKVACMNSNTIVHCITDMMADIIGNDRRVGGGKNTYNIIGIDEALPHLFIGGFPTLTSIPLQTLPEFVICDIDQHMEPFYIDVAESFGLPADVCSRCSAETGVTLDDAFPIVGKAAISSNTPCNASESTSMFQRRRFEDMGLAYHPFMNAMQHNSPEGHDYTLDEMMNTIKFIEDVYGVKWDMDAMMKVAERSNAQLEYEHQKWDYFKTPYSPLGGIAETLYKLVEFALGCGMKPYFTKNDKKVVKIMEYCYVNKIQPYKGKTRHRAFLWGPSAVYYCDFPTWTQNCWGLAIVLNMDSTMGNVFIDTSDPDRAMYDIARIEEKGIMRHHAVGGWDNVNAVWDWAKQFNCDMVICNDNVACKGMNGIHSMLEEEANAHGFRFLFLPQDLEDHRTISRQDMRNTINNYMSVVLNEEPLDPTLVEFDDSLAW